MNNRKTILLIFPTIILLFQYIFSQDVVSRVNLSLDLEIREPAGVIFNKLTDIACDKNDNIYVLDKKEAKVYVFSSEGRYLKNIGRLGEGPGEFRKPCSLYIDSNDLIFVLDESNRRIEIFNKEADYVKSIKIINFPGGSSKNVIVSKSGNIYISGYYKASNISYLLAKFSSTGEFLEYIPLPMKEYNGIELNVQDRDMVASYLSGGSICIDKNERIYFSHAWPYSIERVTNDSSQFVQYARKNDLNWTPIIFRTDRMNGLLFSDFTQTKKIFPLNNQFIVNSLFVVDWKGDPRKQMQTSSPNFDPDKYIKVMARYTVVDIYSNEMEFIASSCLAEKAYILGSDKQGRLLGIRYDANDLQTIIRYKVEIKDD
jgi:hypothetical protein